MLRHYLQFGFFTFHLLCKPATMTLNPEHTRLSHSCPHCLSSCHTCTNLCFPCPFDCNPIKSIHDPNANAGLSLVLAHVESHSTFPLLDSHGLAILDLLAPTIAALVAAQQAFVISFFIDAQARLHDYALPPSPAQPPGSDSLLKSPAFVSTVAAGTHCSTPPMFFSSSRASPPESYDLTIASFVPDRPPASSDTAAFCFTTLLHCTLPLHKASKYSIF